MIETINKYANELQEILQKANEEFFKSYNYANDDFPCVYEKYFSYVSTILIKNIVNFLLNFYAITISRENCLKLIPIFLKNISDTFEIERKREFEFN